MMDPDRGVLMLSRTAAGGATGAVMVISFATFVASSALVSAFARFSVAAGVVVSIVCMRVSMVSLCARMVHSAVKSLSDAMP